MDREEQLIQAAIKVFFMYGVKRSTMHDIAQEAGVSRQTLYNTFTNKEEVLRGVIRHFGEEIMADLDAAGENSHSFSELIDAILNAIAIRSFERFQATPHADDIVEGVNLAAKDEIQHTIERVRLKIGRLLVPYSEALEESHISPATLAEVIQRICWTYKADATSRNHLNELLRVLKTMLMSVYEAGASKL